MLHSLLLSLFEELSIQRTVVCSPVQVVKNYFIEQQQQPRRIMLDQQGSGMSAQLFLH